MSTLSVGKKRAVIERDGGRCVKCGSTDKLEVDHKVPILGGGSDDFGNLQTLCRKCHQCKTKVDIATYRSEMRNRIMEGKGTSVREPFWKRALSWIGW